jgi:hypothetical protein
MINSRARHLRILVVSHGIWWLNCGSKSPRGSTNIQNFPSASLGGLTLNHEPSRNYNPESVIGLVRNSGRNRITKVEGNGSSVAPWVTGKLPNAPSLLAHRITAITAHFECAHQGSIPCGPAKIEIENAVRKWAKQYKLL